MTSLAQRTAKNSLYGFLSYVVPIAFTIVITPIIIRKLGVEEYGLFVLASVITGFFSLFKFGLGYGVTKKVSQYYGDKNPSGVSEIISSTFALFALIGIFGLVASAMVGWTGLHWLNISPEHAQEASVMFALSGVAFLFGSMNSTFTNAIAAAQRLDIYTKIYLSGMIMLNAGMLALLFAGYGIVSLVAMQAIVNILLFVAYRIATARLLPEIPVHLKYFHAQFKPYISLNFYAYVHEAATTLLFEFDKVLVATVAGPAAVSYYSIAGTVGQKIQGTIGSLTSIVMPVSSSLSAANQPERVSTIYQRTMRITLLIAGTLTAAVVGFGPEILRYWVGSDFEKFSLQPLYILAATYFFLALFTVLGHFLLGIGEVKRVGQYTSIFAVLNLALLALLLPTFGILGAAWAYLLCLLPLPYILAFSERKFLGITNRATFYFTHGLQVVSAGLVMYLLAQLLSATLITGFSTLILWSLAWLAGYLLLYRVLKFLNTEDWQVVTSVFRRMLRK